ncbi:TPA: hypothetical protein ACH3X1_004719 [Trebouxia sp. C0004]
MIDVGAAFVRTCRSSPVYELYAITDPANNTCKPGMVAVGKTKGKAIELEIWDLPVQRLGDFFLQISEPLGLGTVCLDDQSKVKGFICEGYVADVSSQAPSMDSPFESSMTVENITHHGSWKQEGKQEAEGGEEEAQETHEDRGKWKQTRDSRKNQRNSYTKKAEGYDFALCTK